MPQENSSDWISGIVTLIKWTVVAFLAWMLVGGGMAGLYHWYKREVVMVTADDLAAERFGNKVFLIWIVATLLACFWIAQTPSLEVYDQLMTTLAWIQIAFFVVCGVGLSYFCKKIV